MLTDEQIAEGKRLLDQWPESPEFAAWLLNHATALLDTAERCERYRALLQKIKTEGGYVCDVVCLIDEALNPKEPCSTEKK